MLTFLSRKCFSTILGLVSSLDLSWKSIVGRQKFQMFCVFVVVLYRLVDGVESCLHFTLVHFCCGLILPANLT